MELPHIPQNKDLTYLGYSTYRDKNQLFGIKRRDRRQHTYVLGKSGTGKSALMFNMIIQNIVNGEGVCVIDPHGELVESVLSAIPPERVRDVVYFNPADTDYHIGFNVLEIVDPKYKNLVSSGLMGIFTKIWANAWSARMEYILNNTILALLDTPETTLLGVTRMLVDKDYRQKIIANLKDPVIKAFWIHEYEAWQDKFRNEAIAPIQNKVGQFLSSAIIRNVVGQPKSTINIFDIMNQGKIFLVNVSKGRIGEDNSRLIGGMLITKLQLAAMERVRIPEDTRRDFYLYVDEFQNFVTDSFASILSEARKYRLNLIVAHQYTAQLVTKESSNVRDAIFGNVGTMIVFRVGADDADFLEKEFAPEFTPEDIVNLPNYKIYLKLMIDGVTSRPFSAKTLPPLVKGGNKEVEEEVIRSSRELYCKSREEVERDINSWSGMTFEGDEANNNMNGAPGKFTARCSVCGKDTTVPFEPQPGRPVYCKDCIAKIKSGEVKPIKSDFKPSKLDEAKYYKPLADIGIEFPATEYTPQESKSNNNINRDVKDNTRPNRDLRNDRPGPAFARPNRPQGVIGAIKNVFNPNRNNDRSNLSNPPIKKPFDKVGLKDMLDKAISENKIVEKKEEPKIAPAPAISLSELKKEQPKPKVGNPTDRSANADAMNSLKSLLNNVTPQSQAPVNEVDKTKEIPKQEPAPVIPKVEIPKAPHVPPVSTPVRPTPPSVTQQPIQQSSQAPVFTRPQVTNQEPQKTQEPKPEEPKQEPKPTTPPNTNTTNTKEPKEVPEEVLRKVLEE